MRIDEEAMTRRLKHILRQAPRLMRVLEVARTFDLPDWLIFSGAVYQPVLNHLTGRPSEYGLRDYDLAYFDDRDISYDAEDAVFTGQRPPLTNHCGGSCRRAIKRACISGSSANLARHVRLFRQQPKPLNGSRNRFSRWECDWRETDACTSKRLSSSATSLRCAYIQIRVAKLSISSAWQRRRLRVGRSS
jgi:hypothetical protein